MSKRIIDKCNLHVEPFKPGRLCNFTTANGGKLNAIGTVTIDYNLNGLIIPFETVVLDNLSESCIFGSDFLARRQLEWTMEQAQYLLKTI